VTKTKTAAFVLFAEETDLLFPIRKICQSVSSVLVGFKRLGCVMSAMVQAVLIMKTNSFHYALNYSFLALQPKDHHGYFF